MKHYPYINLNILSLGRSSSDSKFGGSDTEEGNIVTSLAP